MNIRNALLALCCMVLTACPQDLTCEDACYDQYGWAGPTTVSRCECDGWGNPYVPFGLDRTLSAEGGVVSGGLTLEGARVGTVLRVRRIKSNFLCSGTPRQGVIRVRRGRTPNEANISLSSRGMAVEQPFAISGGMFSGVGSYLTSLPKVFSMLGCRHITNARISGHGVVQGSTTIECGPLPVCSSRYRGRRIR